MTRHKITKKGAALHAAPFFVIGFNNPPADLFARKGGILIPVSNEQALPQQQNCFHQQK